MKDIAGNFSRATKMLGHRARVMAKPKIRSALRTLSASRRGWLRNIFRLIVAFARQALQF